MGGGRRLGLERYSSTVTEKEMSGSQAAARSRATRGQPRHERALRLSGRALASCDRHARTREALKRSCGKPFLADRGGDGRAEVRVCLQSDVHATFSAGADIVEYQPEARSRVALEQSGATASADVSACRKPT